MKALDYWDLFLMTGAPEFYTRFRQMIRLEEQDVSENPGTCAPPNGVQ